MKKSIAAKKSAAAHQIRLGKDPYFDWTVVLGLFIATVVLCLSFAGALWQTANSDLSNTNNSLSDISASSTISLNAANLVKVIKVQSQKSASAVQYQQGYSGPTDPSI